MPDDNQKLFRCTECGHTQKDTVPSLIRCPTCGRRAPRPERGYFLSPERSHRPPTGNIQL